MSETLERQIKSISSKLTTLLSETKEKKTETWVKSTVIIRLTGWSYEEMRTARNNNYVRYRKDNGFWYLLESINPKLYKTR